MQDGEEAIRKLLEDPKFDKALGCVYGAFIGDALGSYCEFESGISNVKMDNVMKMLGGGTFNTAPGQVTDDSELALHLGRGLIDSYNPQLKLKDQHNSLLMSIAYQYIDWVHKGMPFDMGNTTSSAIRKLDLSRREPECDKYIELAHKEVS